MAQLPCIGLYKPCIHLPFGDCAMYFDHGVKGIIIYWILMALLSHIQLDDIKSTITITEKYVNMFFPHKSLCDINPNNALVSAKTNKITIHLLLL